MGRVHKARMQLHGCKRKQGSGSRGARIEGETLGSAVWTRPRVARQQIYPEFKWISSFQKRKKEKPIYIKEDVSSTPARPSARRREEKRLARWRSAGRKRMTRRTKKQGKALGGEDTEELRPATTWFSYLENIQWSVHAVNAIDRLNRNPGQTA